MPEGEIAMTREAILEEKILMKLHRHLQKIAHTATALLLFALPGCQKQETSETAPATPEDHAQSVPEATNYIQAPETTTDQDMHILKEVADNELANDSVAAMYGPPEILPPKSEQPQENADDMIPELKEAAQEAMPKDQKKGRAKGDEKINWSDFKLDEAKIAYSVPRAIYGPAFPIAPDGPIIDITLHRPEIIGSMNKRAIQKAIQKYKSNLYTCYTNALSQHKDLKGDITFAFIINSAGKVTSAVIKESTLNHKDLETCLIDKIKTWKFPPSNDGGTAQVTYPMSFTTITPPSRLLE